MLKKDFIELCLLHLLCEQDFYGYELLQLLHASFPTTQESAMYALLRGLCKSKYTQLYEGDISDGPTRKYYRITQLGKDKYNELLKEWRHLRDTLAAMGI